MGRSALDPRNWSRQLHTGVHVALVLLGMFLVGTSFFINWQARQLSGVKFNHIVGHDANGYYQRPTGHVDSRERITPQQAETYERISGYAQIPGLAGSACILLVVIIALLQRRRVADGLTEDVEGKLRAE
jgi:hypothetical protein